MLLDDRMPPFAASRVEPLISSLSLYGTVIEQCNSLAALVCSALVAVNQIKSVNLLDHKGQYCTGN